MALVSGQCLGGWIVGNLIAYNVMKQILHVPSLGVVTSMAFGVVHCISSPASKVSTIC